MYVTYSLDRNIVFHVLPDTFHISGIIVQMKTFYYIVIYLVFIMSYFACLIIQLYTITASLIF